MAQGFTLNSTVTPYAIPLYAVTSWPAQNDTNPERRTWLVPLSSCLLALSTLVLFVRIYSRTAGFSGKLGLDDALITVAWVFATIFTGFTILGVERPGFDRHVWDLPINAWVRDGFLSWICMILFHISTCLTKISILLFYRRLTVRSYNSTAQKAIYVAITFTIFFLLAFGLSLIFICVPTSASWTGMDIFSSKMYKCHSRRIADILHGTLSIITDLYVLIIPNLVVMNMQLPRKQKLMLYAIFSCGSITIVSAISRTYWLVFLHTDPIHDISWTGYNVFVWSQIELHSALICASAPAIKGITVAAAQTVIKREVRALCLYLDG
ncbi:hypothetical protein E2P81_ATG09958 [Venturia nashicola]|nr:hypothetical protein E2P81_ATG09958 [Venturia nashicola]